MIKLGDILSHRGVRAETEEEVEKLMKEAFRNVFLTGKPTEQQRLLVLSELARASRYFDICEDMDPIALATQNGNRASFAHIVSLVFEENSNER